MSLSHSISASLSFSFSPSLFINLSSSLSISVSFFLALSSNISFSLSLSPSLSLLTSSYTSTSRSFFYLRSKNVNNFLFGRQRHLENKKEEKNGDQKNYRLIYLSLTHFRTNLFPFQRFINLLTSFIYLSIFSQRNDKYRTNFATNGKSIDGVLGTRTRGGRMEGADESTELWRHLLSLTQCDQMFEFKDDPIVSIVAQKVDTVVFTSESDVFKRPQKP